MNITKPMARKLLLAAYVAPDKSWMVMRMATGYTIFAAQIVKNGKGVVIGGEWISVKAPAFKTCSEAVAHFNKGNLNVPLPFPQN